MKNMKKQCYLTQKIPSKEFVKCFFTDKKYFPLFIYFSYRSRNKQELKKYLITTNSRPMMFQYQCQKSSKFFIHKFIGIIDINICTLYLFDNQYFLIKIFPEYNIQKIRNREKDDKGKAEE